MAITAEAKPGEQPAGEHSIEKTLELISPELNSLDLRKTDGTAELVWLLENKKEYPVRARLELTLKNVSKATENDDSLEFVEDSTDISLDQNQASWIHVVGESSRNFRSREAQEFVTRVAISPDAEKCTFELSAVGINESDPDHDFTVNPDSTVTIEWEPVPLINRMRKWKLLATILLSLLLLASGGTSLYRWCFPPKALDVLTLANGYAADAAWEEYWGCWTPQGQHKLVYWMGYELRRAADNDTRWRQELQAWLGSFGLTLDDLSNLNHHPVDVSGDDATDSTYELRRTIQDNGRSTMQFFVTAARWNQFTDQDWTEYEIRKKNGNLRPDENDFASQQDMTNWLFDQFRFYPLCEVPARDEFSKEVKEFVAVSHSQLDTGSDDSIAPPCLLCSDVKAKGSDIQSTTAADDQAPVKQAHDRWSLNRHKAVTLDIHKRNGVWLLDDFLSTGAVSGDIWNAAVADKTSALRKVTIQNSAETTPTATLVFKNLNGGGDPASGESRSVVGTLEKVEEHQGDDPTKWKQTLLFIEGNTDGRRARKIQDRYEFEEFGNVYLKVTHNTAPDDESLAENVFWLSKPDSRPLVKLFEGTSLHHSLTLLRHLQTKESISFLIDQHVVARDEIQNEQQVIVSGIYVDEPVAELRNSRQQIRRLKPNELVPLETKLYLELDAKFQQFPRVVNSTHGSRVDIGAFEVQNKTYSLNSRESLPLVRNRRSRNSAPQSRTPDKLKSPVTPPDADLMYQVNSLTDEASTQEGLLNLREAVELANTSDSTSPPVITFKAALFDQGPARFSLQEGQLSIRKNVTIVGPGSKWLTIDGQRQSRHFLVEGPAATQPEVEISGLTLTNGFSEDVNGQTGPESAGGSIRNLGTLRLLSCVVTNNESRSSGGGAIANEGTLTINNCTLSDNTTQGAGGALDNTNRSNQTVITRSTIARNRAQDGGGLLNSTRLVVDTSTISGNIAGAYAGGIYTRGALKATTIVSGSTIAFNSAGDGGGIYHQRGGSTRLLNSIVAENVIAPRPSAPGSELQGADFFIPTEGGECQADYCVIKNILSKYLISESGEADTNQFGVDSSIGPLAFNGGDNRTHALLPGSPAIDRGKTVEEPYDQRGMNFDRSVAGKVDIGAYEIQLPEPEYLQDRKILVDVSGDEFDGVYGLNNVSLREAIDIANRLPVSKSATEITFSPGVFAATSMIQLNGAELCVASPLSITTSQEITIDAMGRSRVFLINDGSSERQSHVILSGLNLVGGQANEDGGAILSHEELTLNDCRISGNVSGGDGGGVANHGTAHFIQSTIEDNSADFGGGVASGQNSTADFTGSTILKNSAYGGAGIYNQGSTTLTRCRVSANTVLKYAYLRAVSVSRMTIQGKTVDVPGRDNYGRGGGIINDGLMQLIGSTVSDNRTYVDGGGIMNFQNLYILGSTLSNNKAFGAGAGGISNDYLGSIRIHNSTISANRGHLAGGLYNGTHCTLMSTCVTITNNVGDNAGGLLSHHSDTGTVRLRNTILAGNWGRLSTNAASTLPLDASYSLIPHTEPVIITGEKNVTVENPRLGPLQDNGGPTLTHALLPGSPAIDAGDPALIEGLPADQRGSTSVESVPSHSN